MMKHSGTVLVTGANRGLGREVCRQLGHAGMRILLSARDARAGQEAVAELLSEGLDVTSEVLDVTSEASIAALAERLGQQGVRLAALVNNAGIAMTGFDAQVAERTLTVNFFGPLRVTERLLPLMNEHGRIVMVTSRLGELKGLPPHLRTCLDPPASKEALIALMRSFIEHVRTGDFADRGWPGSAYRVSKLGLNALTRLLAAELSPRRLLVNAVSPGWVRTRMGGEQAPTRVADGADSLVWAATLPPEGPTGGVFRDRRPIPW